MRRLLDPVTDQCTECGIPNANDDAVLVLEMREKPLELAPAAPLPPANKRGLPLSGGVCSSGVTEGERRQRARRTLAQQRQEPQHPPPSGPPCPVQHPLPRFALTERVLCKMAGGQWVAGEVALINEPDPHHEAELLPYVAC